MEKLAEIVEYLSQSMQNHEDRIIRESEFRSLSATQIHYLDSIVHLKNPTITQIALYLGVSKPTATIALEKLEHMNLLTKIPSTEDKRVTYIQLTGQGEKISQLHDFIHEQYANYFKESLSDQEVQQCIHLLQKVTTHIKSKENF